MYTRPVLPCIQIVICSPPCFGNVLTGINASFLYFINHPRLIINLVSWSHSSLSLNTKHRQTYWSMCVNFSRHLSLPERGHQITKDLSKSVVYISECHCHTFIYLCWVTSEIYSYRIERLVGARKCSVI